LATKEWVILHELPVLESRVSRHRSVKWAMSCDNLVVLIIVLRFLRIIAIVHTYST